MLRCLATRDAGSLDQARVLILARDRRPIGDRKPAAGPAPSGSGGGGGGGAPRLGGAGGGGGGGGTVLLEQSMSFVIPLSSTQNMHEHNYKNYKKSITTQLNLRSH